jgi:hypothetical protein
MFEPEVLSHEDVVDRLLLAVAKTRLSTVTSAFLASLSTRRLDWRSALGSYTIGQYLPPHNFAPQDGHCTECGERAQTGYDWSLLNFERLKWGGIRHDQPSYIAFDLEQFAIIPLPTPMTKDVDILSEIIQVAERMPPESGPRDLESALSKVLPSNQSEREALLQILGYCGVLEDPKHPGFVQHFVPYSQRQLPNVHRLDWSYPICWWRGAYGVNAEALLHLFPQLAC